MKKNLNMKNIPPDMPLIMEEKSQKERILTASKTIWMLTSWHKTLVPALGS